jgi:hypothetical protein
MLGGRRHTATYDAKRRDYGEDDTPMPTHGPLLNIGCPKWAGSRCPGLIFDKARQAIAIDLPETQCQADTS